jgi:hypothetical protein
VPETNIAATRKPSKVLTVEYGSFHSSHPVWEILRPEELRQRYLAKTLGRSGDEACLVFIIQYSVQVYETVHRKTPEVNPAC